MKGIWKVPVQGIVIIMLLLFGGFDNYGTAAYVQAGKVFCEDGRVLAANPFGIPDLMCGERKNVRIVIEPPTDFVLLFGEYPTHLNSEASGHKLRSKRYNWEQDLIDWGGIVSPADVLNPNSHEFPDAVKSAIGNGSLNSDFFNDANIAEVEAWFIVYEVGAPIYTLRDDGDNGYVLAVKFVKLPTSFRLSGEVTLVYPGLGIAGAQVRMAREGICFNNRIGLLHLVAIDQIFCPVQ